MFDGYIIVECNKLNNQIIEYAQVVNGTKIFSNYFWLITLFTFGIGFFTRGMTSFLAYKTGNFQGFSYVEYIPQGILLTFYGSCALILSLILLSFLSFNIGSGKNRFDLKNQRVTITRRGSPFFTSSLNLRQRNLKLYCSFTSIKNIEFSVTDGLNPRRCIYLNTKDGTRIPLTPSNSLRNLQVLEDEAIFISKILKTELKINKT
nr:photosystem I assembly protein ycf4 [Meringosphaera mediterranea]